MKKKSLSRRDFLRLGSAGSMGAAFFPWAATANKASRQTNSPTYIPWNKSDVLTDVNLLDDLHAWKSWSPTDSLAPYFQKGNRSETGKDSYLEIKGTNKPEECGCWMRSLPILQAGKRYHVKVKFSMWRVERPGHSIKAITTTESGESSNVYMELNYRGMEGSQHVMGLDIVPKEALDNLVLRLYLAWSKQGIVQWPSAHFYEMHKNSIPSRIVKAAAIGGGPRKAKNVEECMDFYCRRLDEVGKKGVDIVCLPELINTFWSRVAKTRRTGNFSEPIPGPSFNRLAEKANQYSMYLATSLGEKRDGFLYNTAVLINKVGKLVGKYEKTRTTINESLIRGTTPGDKLPVFHTDIGKIGIMTCYDNHFPEVSRILAVKGADIIMYPNNSDGRENGTMYEPYLRTRAMDNQVHIVAAVIKKKQTCIVSPRGEILDRTAQKHNAIAAMADCDLNSSVVNGSKRPIGKRYLQIRRPRTYDSLTRPLYHLEPYSRVRLGGL